MAYGTNAGLDAHWLARGYDGSLLDATDKDRLRTIASGFVDSLGWRLTNTGVRVSRFSGQPTTAGQEDSWPRKGATDIYGNVIADNVVPGAVERAVYEAAFHENENAGALNESILPSEIIKVDKVGPLSTTFMDVPDTNTATRPIIPAVETFLAPVLTGGSNPFGITGVVA